MGTGFSLDPNEHRAAANVIEGYGAIQADHGATLAAGTSTPLSSSGSGIAGAIAQIAQGTVQKIVTDVTSTTKGFADDTAKGLRTQAASVEQLDTDLAGHYRSILNGAQSSPLLSGGFPSGGMSSSLSSPLGYSNGSMSSNMSSPLMTSTPLGASSLGEGGPSESGFGESSPSGAMVVGQETPQESSMLPQGMRGAAGAGATEERGQRPGYLKSKTDPAKAAIDKHVQECGTAPIPLGRNQLVCAKCGSILEIGDAETPNPQLT